MDPYLEDHLLWLGVHTWFIAVLGEALGPQLPERYYVEIEERFYIGAASEPHRSGVADALVAREATLNGGANGRDLAAAVSRGQTAQRGQPAVLTVELPGPGQLRQRSLEVRSVRNHEVVTVIEVLSPTNKLPGDGRKQYEAKRRAALDSYANLVEIDLLRAGKPLPMRYMGQVVDGDLAGDYRVLISRAQERRQAELMVCHLRDPLPTIPVPLRAGDPEPQIDLQAVLRTVYERGQYIRKLDYRGEPDPPLRPDDQTWADELLRARRGPRND
jgi:hypothetical protein